MLSKQILRQTAVSLALLASLGSQAMAADWQWATERDQRALADQLRQRIDRNLPHLTVAAPQGNAQVALQPMFSAQAGSWPFEPFVNNGLFRAIASYQPSHPQVITISGGAIPLEQLHQRLGDVRIIKPYKDGYLLSYPLMIAPGGGLLVHDTKLYLYTPSGTALINQGTLSIRNATVQSISEGDSADTDRPFRPFIMAWAGSRTEVSGALLSRLGYNAHLSRGLSSARSAAQTSAPPAQVLIHDSRVEALSSVELQYAQASIERSEFTNLQQYGIDLQDTRLNLAHNRISEVRNQSGIRVRGASSGLIAQNSVLKTTKAGIEISDQQGDLALTDNQIGASQGNGVLLRNVGGNGASTLLLAGNLIGNNDASGIYADNLQRGYLIDNRIQGSPDYAISTLNPRDQRSELVIIGNTLGRIGNALIRTEGLQSLTLGNNDYQLGPITQSVLAGDLLPLQSLLLDATYKRGCLIQVQPASATEAAFPRNQACRKTALGAAEAKPNS
ncbi:right-handed parallel beta-helix repeat-containing protein [Pseudomonas fulva]|uniref:right-handed parallel beta-helix repeat-containing protein n=1 Tax=Pseudomonas fulva TaxID=47880 RepID=UPI00201D5870|nr:right-handed parallel beta-helix repeat-containing protein [Pseudomonas fulva]UQY36207.1 right-handed parallel beta-helix repeat-containing protein [Pseudomonas fulva]